LRRSAAAVRSTSTTLRRDCLMPSMQAAPPVFWRPEVSLSLRLFAVLWASWG